MILFTLFFTLGVWLLQQQAALPALPLTWLLAGFMFALFIRGSGSALRSVLIATLSCGIGFFYAAWLAEQRLSVTLPYEWQGRDITVTGVIAQLPHQTERGQRFFLAVEQTLTDGVKVPGKIYLSTYSDPKNPPPIVRAGERWQFTVRLKQPHGTRNPYGFDFERWALENNVRATGYVQNRGRYIRIDPLASGYRIESWREAVRDKLTATLGGAPYAGIVTALAIGDQDSIPQDQWQLFRRTGVVHLMSISGLHITMLAGMNFSLIYWLWRRSARLTLWLPARKAAVIAACVTAYVYSLLAGYGIPAQRTIYMVFAVALALFMNRNFSPGQIISFALMAVLIADPWAVLSAGFLLSFTAVALILYTNAHRIGRSDAKASYPQLAGLLREYAHIQWAMCIGLIPLLLALFGQVSLVSPLANAFAIPLISLIVVPLALLGAALPGEVPLWLAHIALDTTMAPLQVLSEMPVWIQHAPPAWSIAAGMLGALWLLAPRGFPARHLGVLLMLPMFLNSPDPPENGSLRLIIFDVGQGLSVAAMTQHHALLYDTGPDYANEAGNRLLIPALRGMGINALDGLILSHDDTDHAGAADSVLQDISVNWMMSSSGAASGRRAIDRCQDGMRWSWDGVLFEILHPADISRKPRDNNHSCVLRISTGSQHILLPGDIEWRGEQRLLQKHPDRLAATLLVVPHHGSDGSSSADFVAAVLPDYAVFTSGYRNRFGHPRERIVQRYLDSGAVLLRSDRDGAILVMMNAQAISVERYRETHRRYWMHLPQ